jgi:transposase
MLLTTILNHCQRFAGFVMEKASLCRKTNSIDVAVRARANSKPICSSCDKPGSTYDHLAARRFQHVPIYNMKVTFVYRMRRVDCKSCGVTVETVPWGSGKRRMTNTFMLFLGHWAKLLSWKQTAKCFGVCPDTVFMAVEWVVQWGLKHRRARISLGMEEVEI